MASTGTYSFSWWFNSTRHSSATKIFRAAPSFQFFSSLSANLSSSPLPLSSSSPSSIALRLHLSQLCCSPRPFTQRRATMYHANYIGPLQLYIKKWHCMSCPSWSCTSETNVNAVEMRCMTEHLMSMHRCYG
jgi:hypothetical protein